MECLTKMWRIRKNPRCNEWNDEPERLAASYEIIGERKDNYICRRAGKEYILEKKSFYKTKEECETAIVLEMMFPNTEKTEEYEYAAFAWNPEKEAYEQVGRAQHSEFLCRDRFMEAAQKGWYQQVDTSKVIFRKRKVITLAEAWEDLKED